jgi:DNA gyrase subunit B
VSRHIEVLHWSEVIRRRAEAYVGPVDDPSAATTLLKEALCCARDDALNGTCRRAEVTLYADGRCTVRDDGPGWPLDVQCDGRRLAECYLTTLWACAEHKSTPETSKSTCVVGLAVVNALSEWLSVRIFRDGSEWAQRYARGHAVTALEVVAPTTRSGTELSLQLDASILRHTDFDLPALRRWIETDVAPLEVHVTDLRSR